MAIPLPLARERGLPAIDANRHAERAAFRELAERECDRRARTFACALRLCDYSRIVASVSRDDTEHVLATVAERLRAGGVGPIFHVDAGRLAFLGPDGPEEPLAFLTELLETLGRDPRLRTRSVVPAFVLGFLPVAAGQTETCLQKAMFALIQEPIARNCVVRFDEASWAKARWAFAQEAECVRALRESEFALHLQPLVDAERRIVGAEGLLRWHHPRLGILAPDSFIETLEENSRFADFGLWIVERGCRILGRWRRNGLEALTLSINVTGHDLCRADFAGRVLAMLEARRVRPERLQLELTERIAFDPDRCALAALRRLKEGGVRLALDDFGTGRSTLDQLQHDLFSVLKVDKTFLERLHTSPRSSALYGVIIDLAARLGLDLIAEGVETESQYAALRRLGVSGFQGFLFAPALEPDAFLAAARADRRVRPAG